MTLRVNLILESEQRSASFIQPRTALRIGGGVLTAIPVVAVGVFLLSYRAQRLELQNMQAEWRRLEPRFAASLKLKEELALQTEIRNELEACRRTRIAWADHLGALRDAVPASVQLTEMRVTHQMIVTTGGVPARVYEINLAGKTGGTHPESNVREFQNALATGPAFESMVESVQVPPNSFKQDPDRKATRNDRVFELVCKYRLRSFR
jgi:Tfp pilus assembly protein PilN